MRRNVAITAKIANAKIGVHAVSIAAITSSTTPTTPSVTPIQLPYMPGGIPAVAGRQTALRAGDRLVLRSCDALADREPGGVELVVRGWDGAGKALGAALLPDREQHRDDRHPEEHRREHVDLDRDPPLGGAVD